MFAISNSAANEKIRRATVALVENEKLYSQDLFNLGEVYRFCTYKEFLTEKLWSNCSGTLIGKDLILTAGHCISKLEDCQTKSYVFDYADNDTILEIQNNPSRIYRCKKIVAWSQPIPQLQLVDYAIVQLDREVLDRDPIQVSKKDLSTENDILSYGHPLGLPQKLLRGFISKENAEKNKNIKLPYYQANLSSHPGLSGGGVYDFEANLVGILVRGEGNIEYDDRCRRVRSCQKGDCPWAEIQKLPLETIKRLAAPQKGTAYQ